MKGQGKSGPLSACEEGLGNHTRNSHLYSTNVRSSLHSPPPFLEKCTQEVKASFPQATVLTLPALIPVRLQPSRGLDTYFSQRLQLGLHDELVLAELAAARVRALDPLLQAGLVHEVEAPCAAAGGDQRAVLIPFTVADPGQEDSS